MHLEEFKRSVDGKPRLGVEIFGKALLVVPKTLLENSGMDVQETDDSRFAEGFWRKVAEGGVVRGSGFGRICVNGCILTLIKKTHWN